MKTIKKGMSGNEVSVAQALLDYSVTGTFDSKFVEVVKAFQKKNGLVDDSIIGAKTWAKLAEKAPTVRNRASDKGATLAAQMLLGFTGEALDGICGTKTIARIKAYQAANGLKTDGVCGAKTWARLLCATVQNGKINACKHYVQWDSRWKNVKYSTHTSGQTIGNSGCGTTAMAMILAQWVDSDITPVETSALSVKNGFRTYNSGTAWGFFKFCFKHYEGFGKFVQTNSVTVLKAALAEGALAVCSMNSNDNCFWTKGGHFITAVGYDDEYIYANDPNKSAHPRKQKQAKFQNCMKQAFIFWP